MTEPEARGTLILALPGRMDREAADRQTPPPGTVLRLPDPVVVLAAHAAFFAAGDGYPQTEPGWVLVVDYEATDPDVSGPEPEVTVLARLPVLPPWTAGSAARLVGVAVGIRASAMALVLATAEAIARPREDEPDEQERERLGQRDSAMAEALIEKADAMLRGTFADAAAWRGMRAWDFLSGAGMKAAAGVGTRWAGTWLRVRHLVDPGRWPAPYSP